MYDTVELGHFAELLARDNAIPAPLPREGEVLSWLSKGKNNRDIAQILGLSPRTVDKHLEQIYSKLGVETGNLK